MAAALATEEPATRAGQALTIIAQNIDQAASLRGPDLPGHGHADVRGQGAGRRQSDLDAPADPRSGRRSDAAGQAAAQFGRFDHRRELAANNLGPGTPIIHFEQWEEAGIEVKLILKGGGCENTNAQYALPAELDHLGRADRTLDGVRKCILHAVWKAQGKGCSPGAVGVCIGGDRTSGYLHAKEQLFRTLDDREPAIRGSRSSRTAIMEAANRSRVGPMGFGGKTSLIGCKIGALNRLPASFFVSIAYDCWAFRRLGVRLDATTGAIASWLYREADTPSVPHADAGDGVPPAFPRTGREIALPAPITDEQIRALKVGDVVLISGRDVHRPRRGARAPDEARAAGRSARRRALSLRSRRREGRRRLEGDRRRADDQHPRRALPGGDPQALRRARRDRQGRAWARRRSPG